MMSASALPIISTTGSSTVASVMGNDGRCSISSESRASNRSGAATGTQRAANGANNGPETTTVGIATRTPRARVVPRSAPRVSMAISGPGCGGTSPCIAESPARAGMPIAISESCARRATR